MGACSGRSIEPASSCRAFVCGREAAPAETPGIQKRPRKARGAYCGIRCGSYLPPDKRNAFCAGDAISPVYFSSFCPLRRPSQRTAFQNTTQGQHRAEALPPAALPSLEPPRRLRWPPLFSQHFYLSYGPPQECPFLPRAGVGSRPVDILNYCLYDKCLN